MFIKYYTECTFTEIYSTNDQDQAAFKHITQIVVYKRLTTKF